LKRPERRVGQLQQAKLRVREQRRLRMLNSSAQDELSHTSSSLSSSLRTGQHYPISHREDDKERIGCNIRSGITALEFAMWHYDLLQG
jgi:hypothetical protein